MALRIPTTLEVVARNLAFLESALGQEAPLADKAFLRVLATIEGFNYTELNRFLVERALQVLALTATGEDLDFLGLEYGVTRKPAEAAVLSIEVPAQNGTVIPITAYFVGDSNSERYIPTAASPPAAGGVAALDVQAENTGVSGNLNIGETLTLGTPVAGAENTAEVVAIINLGVEGETDESYRRRVLFQIRTVGGGGNGVDYRVWSEETPGCFRAFPYAGTTLRSIPEFLDGDMERTVITDWTAGNSATLSKFTGNPYEGLRSLRVAYNAVNNPYAYQEPLVVNREYRVTGVARSDSSKIPSIRNGIGTVLWTGTTSILWQAFDVTFTAVDEQITLYNNASSAGYTEFDDMEIFQTSWPGDRVVFVEADFTVDPDGIAPQSLLDDVRDYINIDPTTGKARPPLGMTDENLFVYSIIRTTLNVEIRGLSVPADVEADTKDRLDTEVDRYLRGVTPFIEGVDPPATENDLITDLTLSKVIQEVLDSVGGSAQAIGLYLVASVFLPSYTLGQGELTKLGVITYV